MKFETYIQKIRPMIDTEQPNEDLIWKRISHSLKIRKKQTLIKYLKHSFLVASIIAIAFIAGYHITKIRESYYLSSTHKVCRLERLKTIIHSQIYYFNIFNNYLL